ncbi:MAG: mechanosensitive ion channel, partial [Clostridia bacterium]|nr:mechanosensitive ion channel [Clostridia bacterium]
MNDVNATISSAAGILGSLTLSGILSALLTLLGCLLAKKILLQLLHRGFSRTRLDARLTRFALKTVNAVLWVVILLILCDALGINISSLLALFSVVGLAFSLALQDSLSNLASGIMLLASHPFKPGDYIEAGGQEGTVQTTGVIYTQLVTPDNKRIHVPNSAISA